MRILHVVPTYIPAYRYGGPIYSVHGLCKALVAHGHEVLVATTNVDGPGDSDVPLGHAVDIDGVQVHYFPSRRLRRLYWSPAMAQALRQLISTVDLVHLHSVFLWPTYAAARIAHRQGVPYVLSPRGMLIPELIARKSAWLKRLWITLIETRTLQQAALIHLTASNETAALRSFGWSLPATVEIPNGIDEPPDTPELQAASPQVQAILKQRPLVLFLSRVHWKKGIDRLIQALPLVPEAHLAIAGNDEEGYQPSLEQLSHTLGVAERTHFLGAVRGADKELLLRTADVFVLASVYPENFGNAALEALVRGCPTVVSPELGFAEWLLNTHTATVTQPEPQGLAAAISDILNDPISARQTAQRGQALAIETFSWRAVAQAMEIAYRDILPRQKALTL